MYKKSLLLILALAACDSGGGGGGTPSASVGAFAGDTFAPIGASMTVLDGYDSAAERSANIEIVSATQIKVNGILLTKDTNGTVFRSTDGLTTLDVKTGIEGVTTTQILYMLASQTAGNATAITPLIVGNRTDSPDIPREGTAIYTGKMTVFNDLGLPVTMEGPVLILSLATGDVSGGVTFADRYVTMAPTKMVKGAFSSTLASSETTPVVTGSIDGALYGTQANEIGGTLALEYGPGGTPIETYVGYYGAQQQ